MRETRIKMYIAFDGTEFRDKDECEEYENHAAVQLKEMLKANHSYYTDENGNIYICPKSEEEVEKINNIFNIDNIKLGYSDTMVSITNDSIGHMLIVNAYSEGYPYYAPIKVYDVIQTMNTRIRELNDRIKYMADKGSESN